MLVHSGCSEPSNDQQTLPLLVKKPWLTMVVGAGGKARPVGCHSATGSGRTNSARSER